MKKFIIGFISALVVVGVAFLLYNYFQNEDDNSSSNGTKVNNSVSEKTNTENKETTTNNNETKETDSNSTTKKEESNSNQQAEGYDIKLSKKEITIKKGSESSFDITFTNPDESSIREYIKCDDQSDIVIVKYSDMENKTIKVDVEGLKVGTTEIKISDYNYPDRIETVKVNVVE